MDELIKQFAAQFLVAAVITGMLYVVYRDLSKRMDVADAERKVLLDYILDNTRRTKIIEKETVGDVSPTLPTRPDKAVTP